MEDAVTGGGADQSDLPLAILPGLLCDSRMFADQVAAFGATVVDGHYGTSDRIEAMAAYALARLPDRFALLGHSMGARVALEVWRIAPERVARLALANTGMHPVRPNEAAGRYRLRDLGRAEGGGALVDAWLPPMIGTAGRDDARLVRTLRDMAVAAGPAVYERQIDALLHRPNAEAVLPTIDRPTVVIVGDEDKWAPVSQHQAIAAAIRGAQLRVIDGAGHMAPAEKPGAFNAILRKWLSWP